MIVLWLLFFCVCWLCCGWWSSSCWCFCGCWLCCGSILSSFRTCRGLSRCLWGGSCSSRWEFQTGFCFSSSRRRLSFHRCFLRSCWFQIGLRLRCLGWGRRFCWLLFCGYVLFFGCARGFCWCCDWTLCLFLWCGLFTTWLHFIKG